jgi:predicted SprT family Zn-dependent metalloprotease
MQPVLILEKVSGVRTRNQEIRTRKKPNFRHLLFSRDQTMISRSYIEQQASRLGARLSALIRMPVALIFTDNTRSIISAKWKDHVFKIRLHHMFLQADESVWKAVAGFLSGRRETDRKRLRAFIRRHENKIRKSRGPGRERRPRIRHAGRFFHLGAVFDDLNGRLFQETLICAITWGYRRKRPGMGQVRLGSYSPKTGLIRINPILDRSFVPLYVIEDIVHHEMLHCHLGTVKGNGRTLTHHKTFKTMERAFSDYERAKQWIKRNMHRLLDSYAPMADSTS